MAGTLAKRKVRSMEPWFRRGPFAPLREEFEDLWRTVNYAAEVG